MLAHAPRDVQKSRQRLRGGRGPEPGPSGRSLWHFACATLNKGELINPRAWTGKPPLPLLGSGKLGTPLARMHLAKATIACWRLAGLSGDEPPPSELAVEAPFPEERWATPELEEPPPQPASASVTPRSAVAVSRRIRQFYAVGCFGAVSLSDAGSRFV